MPSQSYKRYCKSNENIDTNKKINTMEKTTFEKFAEAVADIAKVEQMKKAFIEAQGERKVTYDKLEEMYDKFDVKDIADEVFENAENAEKAYQKAGRKLRKAFKEFHAKYMTEDDKRELGDLHINRQFWHMRYRVMERYSDYQFTTGEF